MPMTPNALAAMLTSPDADVLGELIDAAAPEARRLVAGDAFSLEAVYRAAGRVATAGANGDAYTDNLQHLDAHREHVKELRWAEMDASFALGLVFALELSGAVPRAAAGP